MKTFLRMLSWIFGILFFLLLLLTLSAKNWLPAIPVLIITLRLGTRDGLVGNPKFTKQVAQNIPDVQVEILDAGYLISAEQPEQFNQLVVGLIEGQVGI